MALVNGGTALLGIPEVNRGAVLVEAAALGNPLVVVANTLLGTAVLGTMTLLGTSELFDDLTWDVVELIVEESPRLETRLG